MLHSIVSAFRPHMFRMVVAAVAALPLVVTAGCSFMSKPTAKGTKNAVAKHVEDSPITVESRNGSVEIIADASRGDVQIDASIVCEGDTQQQADDRLIQAGLDVSRDTAHALHIKPTFPGGPRGSDGASLTIRTPDARGVTVLTSNGKVIVKSCGGELSIETSNGSVNIADHGGPATVKSSNGSITITGLAGELSAKTSNASVNAAAIKGKATIHASNGAIDLELDGGVVGPIMLDTSNASIRVVVGKAFAGDVELNTSNGSLTIAGEGVNSDQVDRNSAVAHMGAGEKSVVKTSNGSITFSMAK